MLTSKYNNRTDSTPYIIAEIGSNHNGDMDLAYKLIAAAKEAGADCVKFQSWTSKTVFSEIKYAENYFLDDDYRNRSDTNLREIVKNYELKAEQHKVIKQYADEFEIDCASTPFSRDEVDTIISQFNPPFIKVASMDLNNLEFLKYVAQQNKPIILSLGMGSLSEIEEAISTIESEGNKQISILHCVAMYPPDDKDTNLLRIQTLQNIYPYEVGFSDHSMGTEIPLAAITLGATIIEKHFTLDKTSVGWDHHMSADPKELTSIVKGAKRISNALGSRRIFRTEGDNRLAEFRRSVVAGRNLKAGHIVELVDLDFKRPGTGIPPNMVSSLIGKKLAVDIPYDQIINWSDFS